MERFSLPNKTAWLREDHNIIRLKNIKSKPKLIGLFLVVGLIPLAVVGFYAATSATAALDEASFARLRAVRDIKTGQIASYFEERKGDIDLLTNVVVSLQQEGFAGLRE